MTKPLVVLGSINADGYVRIARLPQPGETIPGRDAAVRPGGKGANQAAAAARLGARTTFIGQVGEDAHAGSLRMALEASGVDCSGLRALPGASGQAMILLQDGGENSIVLIGGANQTWDELGAEREAMIARAAALVLQREVPEAINLAAARIARAQAVPVVLDVGGDLSPIAADLLDCADVVSPNETELAAITGLPTASDAEVAAAAEHLLAQGVQRVLVKLGARGSVLFGATREPIRQPAFAAEVVDTTGAGDCFTAAYTVAMSEGRTEAECLRFANAAGSLCVRTLGAMPSMPGRDAVEAVLAAG